MRSVQVDFLHEKGYLQVEHKETYIDEAGESPPQAGQWEAEVAARPSAGQ